MSATVAPMAKTPAAEYCTYANIRIDDAVLPWARAAASLSGKSVQDFLSDVALAEAAKILNRKPLVRRPTPPKPHGPGGARKPKA